METEKKTWVPPKNPQKIQHIQKKIEGKPFPGPTEESFLLTAPS